MQAKTLAFVVFSLFTAGCGQPQQAPTASVPTAIQSETRRPADLVGIWRWQWAQGTVHHIELHSDGRAVQYADTNRVIPNGTWHVNESGELVVDLQMRFRVDDNELMDMEMIRTDRDFPWRKVDRVSDSLTD